MPSRMEEFESILCVTARHWRHRGGYHL
jgi:hypothetical protein